MFSRTFSSSFFFSIPMCVLFILADNMSDDEMEKYLVDHKFDDSIFKKEIDERKMAIGETRLLGVGNGTGPCGEYDFRLEISQPFAHTLCLYMLHKVVPSCTSHSVPGLH